MAEKSQSIFTNSKLFSFAAIIGALGNLLMPAIYTVTATPGSSFTYAAQCIFEAICIFVLYISFNSHEKNVMKGMLGALLSINVLTAIGIYESLESTIDIMIGWAFAVLSIVFFINHFILYSSHKSNDFFIMLNQIVAVLLILIPGILWGVLGIIAFPTGINIVIQVISSLAFSGMILSIVCVESKLDLFKQNREKNAEK